MADLRQAGVPEDAAVRDAIARLGDVDTIVSAARATRSPRRLSWPSVTRVPIAWIAVGAMSIVTLAAAELPQASGAKVSGSTSLLLLMSELDRRVGGGMSTAGRSTRRRADLICTSHASALETSRAIARGADRDRTGCGRTCDRDPGLGCQAIQDSQRLDGTDARTPPASISRPHLQVAAHRPDRRVPPTAGRRQRAMRPTVIQRPPSATGRIRNPARPISNGSSPDPVTSSQSERGT